MTQDDQGILRVSTVPASTGSWGIDALREACVGQVQAIVAPRDGAQVVVHRGAARVTRRPDGRWLIEVPYTAIAPKGEIEGSYVAVSRSDSTAGDFVFLSDRDRLAETEWMAYAAAERPGNLS